MWSKIIIFALIGLLLSGLFNLLIYSILSILLIVILFSLGSYLIKGN
jgi:hypothetical protein